MNPPTNPAFPVAGNSHFPQCWLGLAILSLALSGLAPLLLLAGRASIYAEKAFVQQWFIPILVVHVNLSVGLWFLAMAMMLWSVCVGQTFRMVHKAALTAFGLAILCIASAPLQGGEAFTSNYIPVQDNIVFFTGIGLAAVSLLLMVAIMFFPTREAKPYSDDNSLLPLAFRLNALTVLAAVGCFALSIMQHPGGYGGQSYFEAVFWGGGHILQIAYAQLVLIAWLGISRYLGMPQISDNLLKSIFVFLWFAAALSPLVYVFTDVNSGGHITFFTWQMNAVTGTLPAIVMLHLLYGMFRIDWSRHKPAAWCLLMSLLLFLEGGALGFLIEGSNVIIPAHYHGSTVGVTLALMGLVYVLLPQFGIPSIAQSRLAFWQPILYGVGQIMHVSGLAVAGGHGVARKTAGALDASQMGAEIALQIMRIGGLLAVIGGGLFIVIVARACWRARCSAPA